MIAAAFLAAGIVALASVAVWAAVAITDTAYAARWDVETALPLPERDLMPFGLPAVTPEYAEATERHIAQALDIVALDDLDEAQGPADIAWFPRQRGASE